MYSGVAAARGHADFGSDAMLRRLGLALRLRQLDGVDAPSRGMRRKRDSHRVPSSRRERAVIALRRCAGNGYRCFACLEPMLDALGIAQPRVLTIRIEQDDDDRPR